ncbi:MAG: hypothetical protein ACRCTQ_05130 [Brevinemataceae bacterium]
MWEYLKVIPPVLNHLSAIFRNIMNSVFMQYYSLNSSINQLVKNAFGNLIEDKYLHRMADDRGIIIITGETQESFRNRVFQAFKFLRNSSTVSGMEYLIEKISGESCNIRESFKEIWILGDPRFAIGTTCYINSSASVNFFIVECYLESASGFSDQYLTEKEKNKLNSLYQIIDIYKPCHVEFQLRYGKNMIFEPKNIDIKFVRC